MDDAKRLEFQTLYPEWMPTMDLYENTIFKIAHTIYDVYRAKYVVKNISRVPKMQENMYRLLCKSQTWHSKSPNKNIVNVNYIINSINKLKPSVVNHMIRSIVLPNSTNGKAGIPLAEMLKDNKHFPAMKKTQSTVKDTRGGAKIVPIKILTRDTPKDSESTTSTDPSPSNSWASDV